MIRQYSFIFFVAIFAHFNSDFAGMVSLLLLIGSLIVYSLSLYRPSTRRTHIHTVYTRHIFHMLRARIAIVGEQPSKISNSHCSDIGSILFTPLQAVI